MRDNFFSKKGYISIIELAKQKGYRISPVEKVRRVKTGNTPLLVLRHDVDLDLQAALLMAMMEKDMRVHSTFFVHLYNNHYNSLSPEGRLIIKKISSLGHEIGLHWDSRDHPHDLERKLARDRDILAEIIGKQVMSGSQHKPTSTPQVKFHAILKYEMYRDFIYISDSAMKWRQFTPWQLLKKKQNIHLLAHPFWWMIKGKTREEKFFNHFKNITLNNKKNIKKELEHMSHSLKYRKRYDSYFGYFNKIV